MTVPECNECIGILCHLSVTDRACRASVGVPISGELSELVTLFFGIPFTKPVRTSGSTADYNNGMSALLLTQDSIALRPQQAVVLEADRTGYDDSIFRVRHILRLVKDTALSLSPGTFWRIILRSRFS